MAVHEKLYTADDLWELSARAGESKHLELSRGIPVEMPIGGGIHGVITAELTCLIANHVVEHSLGRVYAAGTGFILAHNPDTVRTPDVAYISKVRTQPLTDDFCDVAPDFAVEVVFLDAASEINEKVIDYFEAGTKLVWIVYPKSQSIHVYQAADSVRILKVDSALDGGDVLPGFSVSLRAVFARLRE